MKKKWKIFKLQIKVICMKMNMMIHQIDQEDKNQKGKILKIIQKLILEKMKKKKLIILIVIHLKNIKRKNKLKHGMMILNIKVNFKKVNKINNNNNDKLISKIITSKKISIKKIIKITIKITNLNNKMIKIQKKIIEIIKEEEVVIEEKIIIEVGVEEEVEVVEEVIKEVEGIKTNIINTKKEIEV